MAFKILNLAIGYLLRIKERERWICNLNIFILLCLPLLGMILQWDVWWWWWWEWRLHSINDFGSLDFELHCRLSSCWYYILKKIEERACVHAFGIIVFYNGINIPADLYQIYLSICSICCQSGRDWKDDDDEEKNESCLTPIWKTYMFCRHMRQRTSKEMICVQKIFLVYWLDIHNILVVYSLYLFYPFLCLVVINIIVFLGLTERERGALLFSLNRNIQNVLEDSFLSGLPLYDNVENVFICKKGIG